MMKHELVEEYWELWFTEANRPFQIDDLLTEELMDYKDLEDFVINSDEVLKFFKKEAATVICQRRMLFSLNIGLPEPKVELWRMQCFSDIGWIIGQRYRIQLKEDPVLFYNEQ